MVSALDLRSNVSVRTLAKTLVFGKAVNFNRAPLHPDGGKRQLEN